VVKEFSKELVTDRKFEIGGVVLEWRYPYWEELTELYEQGRAEVQNGQPEMSSKEQLDLVIHRIGFFLTEDSARKWQDRIQDREEPIPAFQITGLFQWLVEVTSNRPTELLSASDPGAGSTGQSLPDESPSTEETSTA
jgi:hypothetical protein